MNKVNKKTAHLFVRSTSDNGYLMLAMRRGPAARSPCCFLPVFPGRELSPAFLHCESDAAVRRREAAGAIG